MVFLTNLLQRVDLRPFEVTKWGKQFKKVTENHPELVSSKGLSQVLGLRLIFWYRTFKPKDFCECGPKSFWFRSVFQTNKIIDAFEKIRTLLLLLQNRKS